MAGPELPAVYGPFQPGTGPAASSARDNDTGEAAGSTIVVTLAANHSSAKKSADKPVTKYTDAQIARAGRIAQDALGYRGAPYVWGGNGRFGVFDCSGFTQYLYAKRGVKLPHSAKQQFGMGSAVQKSDLQSGDLVFFNTDRGPLTHVGMYLGDGKFIHAANPRRGVVTSRLSESYYAKRYAGARRMSGQAA